MPKQSSTRGDIYGSIEKTKYKPKPKPIKKPKSPTVQELKNTAKIIRRTSKKLSRNVK